MPAVHIIPVSDVREHWKTPECWCEPLVEWGDVRSKATVVHRDKIERDTGMPAGESPERGPWKVME